MILQPRLEQQWNVDDDDSAQALDKLFHFPQNQRMRRIFKSAAQRRRTKNLGAQGSSIDLAGRVEHSASEGADDRFPTVLPPARLLARDLIQAQCRRSVTLELRQCRGFSGPNSSREADDKTRGPHEGLLLFECRSMIARSSSLRDSSPKANIFSRIRSTSAISTSGAASSDGARA